MNVLVNYVMIKKRKIYLFNVIIVVYVLIVQIIMIYIVNVNVLYVKFNLLKLLLPLKVMAQVPLLYLAWRYGKDTASLAGILALSLTLFLMFNPVAWTYQYLLVVFLLILGWMFHSFQPASPSPT